MLKDAELAQVRDYVVRILPELLRSDPEVATTIEGILAQQFPRRDEFARLLDEMEERRRAEKETRSHMDQRFDRVDQQLTEIRSDMDQRFEQVDQRFEQVDQRFEQVDQRFEQVDQRFEQVDQRFEQVDQRFEQVDQRFEQVGQRFEQVDQRFEQVDQRFERIENTMLHMRRDISQLQHGQEFILRRLDKQEDWLKLIVGDPRVERGRTLEDLFASGLAYGLKKPDIRPEHIRLRQKVVDTEGVAFKPGHRTEVDLIAEDHKLTVFEIKATGKASEVGTFALKVELVAAQNPDREVEGIFICPGASEEIQAACQEYGITLVA